MKLTLKRDLPLLLAALLVIWGLWYARPKRVGYWKASSIMVARTDSIVNGSFCRMLSPFGALKFFVNFIHLHLVKCRGM